MKKQTDYCNKMLEKFITIAQQNGKINWEQKKKRRKEQTSSNQGTHRQLKLP